MCSGQDRYKQTRHRKWYYTPLFSWIQDPGPGWKWLPGLQGEHDGHGLGERQDTRGETEVGLHDVSKGGLIITYLLMRTTNLGRFSHLDVYLAQNFPPFFYENFCPNHGRGLGENTFYSTHSRCLHTHRALHILQMWRSFWCSTKHCSALHAGPLLQGWDQAGTPSLFCRTDSSWQVFSISAEKILSV